MKSYAPIVMGLAALVCFDTGCVMHRPALPMTAEALGADGTAAALVAYLGQPGADGRVCAGGELVEKVRSADDLRASLMESLRSGATAPTVWAACLAKLLPVLEPQKATWLLEDVLGAELELLRAPEIERDPALQARLDALQRLSVHRDPGAAASPAERDSALKTLAALRKKSALGPLARSAAGTLTAALDAERGRWGGLPADGAAIAALGLARDEASLEILSRRLPDPTLRGEAERQLVRLRIATIPDDEVRAAAGVVEETVLRTGANPISLAEHPPARATLHADRVPAVAVLVRQDPARGAARLFTPPAGGVIGVLPAVPLRDALMVEVRGVSRPVTVCAPGRSLDPAPCLAPGDVALETTLARVDDGAVVFVGEVSSAVVAELARRGRLEVPVRIGGLAAGGFAWPIAFERPPDVVREAGHDGEAGTDLEVVVERVTAERLVYTVTAPGSGVWIAAVERVDAPAFRIQSRGGRGAAGYSGYSGQSGSSGQSGENASCPPFARGAGAGGAGSAGSNGGDGGAGGPGGRGGDVRVTVYAPPALRDDTLALVQGTVASVGGPGGYGGPGGSGGSGGAGGSGGMGATCSTENDWTFFPSGASGPRGADGASGSSGPDGPAGSPGRVTIEARGP